MRTALILLLLLALASVGGSLLPQTPNSPERVQQYVRDHEVWGEIFRRTGMFDVFGSWWFGLIVVLLFTSLVACLLPRSRAEWRTLRSRPVHAREIDGFAHYAEVRVASPPEEAAAAAREVLRRRRFRTALAEDGLAIAAEKGALREAGSLVFHWAFVLLLVGVVVGKGTGYTGRASIVEGETWTDAAINYDPLYLRLGRFFGGDFSGLGIRLVAYEDAFDPTTGMPQDFVSTVELLDRSGAVVGTDEVRVNHPVRHGPLRIYQYGFGWAPVVAVAADGRPIADGPVVMGQEVAPEDVSQLALPWLGFVKLPQVRPQTDMAVRLELWPDGRGFFNPGMPMFDEDRPLLRYTVYQGKLLDPSRSSLDTRLMEETASGIASLGWTVDLERGCIVEGPDALDGEGLCPPGADPAVTMVFPELRRYTVLQVGKDATVPVVLGAAILILVGLLAALYTSRRKLWVRAEPAPDGGTVVKVGGFALQRKPQFEEEFRRVVDAVVRRAGGATADAPEAAVSR
jgi:cytochrome c biogenesis protein